jgi:hypothetical protein
MRSGKHEVMNIFWWELSAIWIDLWCVFGELFGAVVFVRRVPSREKQGWSCGGSLSHKQLLHR